MVCVGGCNCGGMSWSGQVQGEQVETGREMGRNGRGMTGEEGMEGAEGQRRLVRNGQAQVASCLRVKVSEVLSRDLYCAGTGRIEPAPFPSTLCQLGVCYGPRVPDVPGVPTIQHSSLLT